MFRIEDGICSIDCFEPRVRIAVSTRDFVRSRWNEFFDAAGFGAVPVLLPKQEHTNRILVAETDVLDLTSPADGILTRRTDIALGVKTADCIPAVFWDPCQNVLGVIHAGWRGLHQGILPKTVGLMKEEFGCRAEDIQVVFGPSIRGDFYAVGPEFKNYFPDHYGKPREKHIDLMAIAVDQVRVAGITPGAVFDAGLCTYSEKGLFYSVRREKATPERTLTVARIRPAT
ncbi:MAG: peptidoglycan editing factor PgeF [Candidatus Omnitrophota bacterium]